MSDSEMEYLVNAVEEGEAKPKPKRELPKPPVKPTVSDPNDLVWVKCVTENRPWTETDQLEYWQDYEIPRYLAEVFAERKHAVILQSPTSKGK